ncbi:MAG: twin-arginine translocation signal domain-containing protein [Ignavibacteriae bacterium]|nr:MAG: twin-arginine translocation signal domain-containing protein [Ignavibacteriota bacterium]
MGNEKPGITPSSRRDFIKQSTIIIASAAAGESLISLSGCGKKEEEVTANEDLMREHGLLNRVLLIYDDILNKIMMKADFPPEALKNAAEIIKDFIEDYHERNEETYLFPRMQREGKLLDLITTLKSQHDAGRTITQYILANAQLSVLQNEVSARVLTGKIKSFVNMYRPHEAREDTILFPEFRKLLSSNEYDSLGEDFEKIEHEKFGEDGFDKYLAKVFLIEKQLGIEDLKQYTPAV